MAIGDITWATWQSTLGLAIIALQSGPTQNFLGARIAVTQAKLIALGLGDRVAAAGTSVDLLIAECDKTLAMITEVEMRSAMKSGNGRFISTGLANEGHRRGADHVSHP